MIVIYTNEVCPYCKSVKEELEKQNIEFENKLTKDYSNEWQDVVSLTEIPTVPTVLCDGEYLVSGRDFNSPTHLANILKNYKKTKFDINRRNFEKLKTLNYNISVAFRTLDQTLKQIETKINTNEHKSTD
tara:strand:+ start:647 stop:1036 length:390 start_codon:yes stop_codon:yes gene_type:complete